MEYIDIFDDKFKVSYYRNISDTTSSVVIPLSRFLEECYSPSSSHKEILLKARSLWRPKKEDRKDYDEAKKEYIPNCTIGCTCSPTRTNENAIPNGLACIDVDGHDNPDITDMDLFKQQVSVLPQVAYCAKSLGGNGVYIIIYIAHPDRFSDVYRQLEIDFFKAGVVIDPACKNIARVRVMSYDEHPYINHRAVPYYGVYQQPVKIPRLHTMSADATDTEKKVADYCRLIKQTGINLTCSYDDWREIGMALADLGEAGRQYYHIVSSVDSRYREAETDRKFNNFLQKTRSIHIGTFFTKCHDAGIYLHKPENPRRIEPQQPIAPKVEHLPTQAEKVPVIVSDEEFEQTFELDDVCAADVPDDECIEIPIYDEHLQPTKGKNRYPLADIPQWIKDNPNDVRLFSYWNWSDKEHPLKTIAISNKPIQAI